MSISILAAALLALGTTSGISPKEATHTLELSRAETGCLFVGGVSQSSATIQLANAHVATRVADGGELSTVSLPDGRTYYKGDFTLRVQSVKTGTMEVTVCDGEAVLTAVPD